MPPALNRWLRRLGFALALGGCAYVGVRAWQLVHVAGTALRWPEPGPAALALILCTVSMGGLALGWYALLRACGEPIGLTAAFRAYAVSQPVKYLPGNMLHLVTRHMLGRAEGGTHARLLSAAGLETASLVGMALLVTGIWAGPGVFAPFEASRWWLVAAGSLCLLGGAGYLAIRGRSTGLGWLAAHFAGSAGYFVGTSAAFCLLADDPALPFAGTLPVVSGSWVAGYLVIGAPGGLGVREATMLQLLGAQSAALLAAVVAFRIAAIGADALLFLIASLLGRYSAREPLNNSRGRDGG